jgi:hypothetical protein
MTLKQGRFVPQNPKKYKGDPTQIYYRSGWELKVFLHLDNNPNVIQWSSEEIIISYVSPIDNRRHRYFPDVYAKLKLRDGTIKEYIYEIKPKAQTVEPVKKSRITKRYVNEVVQWGINTAKWKAANEYCKNRGYEFKILTETDLGIK